MAYFNDPYAHTSPDYPRHNYHDSEDYNPYDQVANITRGDGTVRSRYNNASVDERELPAVPRRQNTLQRRDTTLVGSELPLAKSETRHSFTPLTATPGLVGDLSSWRREQHRSMWTRGSRGRCVGRFCCCTIMITLLLIVSIILALVLWVRPPLVLFNGVQTAANGSTFEATTTGEFKINLGFAIFVENPNYFDATFSSITADITYPLNGNNTDVGGGSQKDITFKSHHNTNFTFPFSIVYDKAQDPNQLIITDLVNRCGFIDASTKRDIDIGYKLTLRLKVLFLSVGPSFSGSTSFGCPVTKDQIVPFLSGLGINIPGLSRRQIT